jgi:hypothetical protein
MVEINREALETMITKEALLNEVIVWLRAKGLWEDCQKDLVTKITDKSVTKE